MSLFLKRQLLPLDHDVHACLLATLRQELLALPIVKHLEVFEIISKYGVVVFLVVLAGVVAIASLLLDCL